MNILLTNDDSYDSPLFHILYDTLLAMGHDVQCVMPATEQSWKGKSMTRFGSLKAENKEIDGRFFHTFEGTPADCVNFALHHICQQKPDLIFSGINMGYNVSLSYILSSGTIGACMEGYLAGIPSISISQQLTPELYACWGKDRSFPEAETERLQKQVDALFKVFENKFVELSQTDEMWALELPCTFNDDWQLTETVPSSAHYGSAFVQSGDNTYSHCSPRLTSDDNTASDLNVMLSGNVALNKLDFKSLCKKNVDFR